VYLFDGVASRTAAEPVVQSGAAFLAKAPKPPQGHGAYYVELQFKQDALPFSLSALVLPRLPKSPRLRKFAASWDTLLEAVAAEARFPAHVVGPADPSAPESGPLVLGRERPPGLDHGRVARGDLFHGRR
jgi:hypothetical protein